MGAGEEVEDSQPVNTIVAAGGKVSIRDFGRAQSEPGLPPYTLPPQSE